MSDETRTIVSSGSMSTWEVKVRNEKSGEVCCLTLQADGPVDAQHQAVRHAFREWGWRTATALTPMPVTEEVEA